jgi:poly(3-hydroxybutyrate) depolymerase
MCFRVTTWRGIRVNRRTPALFVVATAAALCAASSACAGHFFNVIRVCTRHEVENLNNRLAGQILDFTGNHRVDRRVYCPSLGQKRDVYVYLPPGYDGVTLFPLMIWMHGLGQDEKSFLDLAPVFDAAIRCGLLPPIVIVAPDGSIRGRPALVTAGSFYMNSKAGRFEDYIVHDIFNFAKHTFCVRAEREAHVLAGASMGGFAAYNLGFKHRDKFGVLVGILPPLDIRYADCHGNYMADYDPACHSYRDQLRPHRTIGRFYGVIFIHEHRVTDPIVGRRNPNGMAFLATQNPVELLDALDIRPGEFEMFIGYSKKDEFNIDAQVEHFIDVAARRGIRPAVVVLPDGRHDTASGQRCLPALGPWLCEKLNPYLPLGFAPPGGFGPCVIPQSARPRLGLFNRNPAPPVWVQTDDFPSPKPITEYKTPP